MPIPRHSTSLRFVQLAADADCGGVTELRVHGVGGTPPDATLGDLAPEQVSGDQIAGFYRSTDHRASAGLAADMGRPADLAANVDVDRHVEVYSWGGLTSRSQTRVLWLVLLPFLLGNLAGWMCSVKTRESDWRFRLHRMSHSLGALALTVNASLVTVLITADILAYQAARAGLIRHQWWLAPLGWRFVSGHPARQVLVGVLVPALLVLVLLWLARRSWRYEAVRPPSAGSVRPASRKITAAALDDGLADEEFWDGEGSVSLLTHLHVAVVLGFLAIVLGVTAKALAGGGSAHAITWWWIAVISGGATLAWAVIYLGLTAFDKKAAGTEHEGVPAKHEGVPAKHEGVPAKLAGVLRDSPDYLLGLAAAALISSGLFAWLQPAGSAGPASLPAMASVLRWTTLAIAVPVVLALLSMLLGISRGSRGTLVGGPWITLMLAFSVLNTVMFGVAIWLAHLVGPVTSNAARPGAKIYLPLLVTSAVPLVAWAAVVTALVFAVMELARWLCQRRLPPGMRQRYQEEAQDVSDEQSAALKPWYWSGLTPFAPSGEPNGGQKQDWERKVARTLFLARAPHDASWLLWSIIIVQLAAAWCAWQLRWQPPVVIRNIGVALAGLALPALMAYLYSAWSNPARRRTIGVLWDVGTFWPRSYHPLSPPSYSERAVPELQRRMWWLHDHSGRVVLVAHSQGAVLATAALVQLGCRPARDNPVLITFGNPVCKLYSWGFPAYLTSELLAPLVPGGQARVGDWRNPYYLTDPIGGPVGTDLPGAGASRVDRELLDPAGCSYVYGQVPPSPQGHSGYWADPHVWTLIDCLAAERGPAPDHGHQAPQQATSAR